jgi:hypothetical protein
MKSYPMSMSPALDCLRVAELVPDGRPAVFLVPSTEAIPLCEREGFAKLAPAQARWQKGAARVSLKWSEASTET